MVTFATYGLSGKHENRKEALELIEKFYGLNKNKLVVKENGDWTYTVQQPSQITIINALPRMDEFSLPRGETNRSSESFSGIILARAAHGDEDLFISDNYYDDGIWETLIGLSVKARQHVTHWYYSELDQMALVVVSRHHIMRVTKERCADGAGLFTFDIDDGPVNCAWKQMTLDFNEWKELSHKEKMKRTPMSVHVKTSAADARGWQTTL